MLLKNNAGLTSPSFVFVRRGVICKLIDSDEISRDPFVCVFATARHMHDVQNIFLARDRCQLINKHENGKVLRVHSVAGVGMW